MKRKGPGKKAAPPKKQAQRPKQAAKPNPSQAETKTPAPKPVQEPAQEIAEDIATMRVRVEGRVQGVGFRAFAVRQAIALELTGWVRNRTDGTMEAMITGPVKRVESFVSACVKGPAGAQVRNVDLFTDKDSGSMGFIELPTA